MTPREAISPPPRDGEAGLSLVETLVAISVIALVSLAVMLAAPRWPSETQAEAERLAARVDTARERALTTGEVIGFSPDDDAAGYAFLVFRDSAWTALPDDPALQPRRLPEALSLYREDAPAMREGFLDDEDAPPAPEIWFDPTGFDDPFVYVIQGRQEIRTVARTDDGAIRLPDPETGR